MLRDDLPDHLVTEWGANHMGGIIAECAAQARAEGYAAGFADARQLAADAVQEYVYPSGTPAPPPMR
jgi:hypothetical protein